MSRINQSIESFCYAILGSQVDVRSSIAGSQGSAIETQRQFLSMVEDAIFIGRKQEPKSIICVAKEILVRDIIKDEKSYFSYETDEEDDEY